MGLDNLIIFGAGSFLAKKILKRISANRIICVSKSLKKFSKKNLVIFKDYKNNNKKKIDNLMYGKKNTVLFLNNFTKDNLIINKSKSEITKELNLSVIDCFENAKNMSKIMIKENFGTLIFFGSSRGLEGDVGISGYSISKNAINGLSKSISREMARFNITSNYLSLGFFESPLFDKIDIKIKKKLIDKTDKKIIGDINSIINSIYFLNKSRYVTGSVIKIDGGYT